MDFTMRSGLVTLPKHIFKKTSEPLQFWRTWPKQYRPLRVVSQFVAALTPNTFKPTTKNQRKGSLWSGIHKFGGLWVSCPICPFLQFFFHTIQTQRVTWVENESFSKLFKYLNIQIFVLTAGRQDTHYRGIPFLVWFGLHYSSMTSKRRRFCWAFVVEGDWSGEM